MLAKKCRHDTVILLFTSAVTSAFAEYLHESHPVDFAVGQLALLRDIYSCNITLVEGT